MSLTVGLIAIKGSFLVKSALIFQMFKLIETGEHVELNTWVKAEDIIGNECNKAIDDGFQKRIIWEDNGWTIIEDFSLLLCTNEDALRKISKELKTSVLSLVTQGTSGSYGFWYFENEKERIFFVVDGKIQINSGDPIVFEKSYSINEKTKYRDLIGLSQSLGVEWERKEYVKLFIVKTLEDSPELKKELECFPKNQQQEVEIKPWWKFW